MEAVAAGVAKNETTLSPLKAVRTHCVEGCCCGQANEVKLCPSEDCALWPYRFGRGPEVKPQLTVLKSVRECWNTECLLFSLRMGHNPNLRGKRGNIQALHRWRERRNEEENVSTRRDSETRTDVVV